MQGLHRRPLIHQSFRHQQQRHHGDRAPAQAQVFLQRRFVARLPPPRLLHGRLRERGVTRREPRPPPERRAHARPLPQLPQRRHHRCTARRALTGPGDHRNQRVERFADLGRRDALRVPVEAVIHQSDERPPAREQSQLGGRRRRHRETSHASMPHTGHPPLLGRIIRQPPPLHPLTRAPLPRLPPGTAHAGPHRALGCTRPRQDRHVFSRQNRVHALPNRHHHRQVIVILIAHRAAQSHRVPTVTTIEPRHALRGGVRGGGVCGSTPSAARRYTSCLKVTWSGAYPSTISRARSTTRGHRICSRAIPVPSEFAVAGGPVGGNPRGNEGVLLPPHVSWRRGCLQLASGFSAFAARSGHLMACYAASPNSP